MKSEVFFVILVCQFGLTLQACTQCACCIGGDNFCDSNGNCITGCIDGYFGNNCTSKCLENCKTCINKYGCTECKPGYYRYLCDLKCGKGCINDTCSITGICSCKSKYFLNGKCDACLNNKYGDECNNTCPINCGSCSSEIDCSWCKMYKYYGSHCQNRCSHGCDQGTCNKENGYCKIRCKPNYTGDKCDTCSPGVYGTYCDLNCSDNCFSCISETNCTKCKDGFYGETCTLSCPAGCKEKCTLADGQCFVCKPGFYGEFCNSSCIDGTYGYNCSEFCNDTDTICRVCFADELNTYGGCIQCNSGYYPVISPGEYYSTCENCPFNCRGHECNTLGFCSNGCLRGKWGDSCNKDCVLNCLECNKIDGKCLECSNKTFSNDCSKNCRTDCNIISSGRMCASDTGECLYGCKTNTKYGEYCDKGCNDNCNNKSCDWKTGHCLDGCVLNHYGLFCDKKCAGSCLSNEDQRACDNDQGHCLHGCKDGFYGSGCESNCSSQCMNTICNHATGDCLYGCADGYEGDKCLQAITGAEEKTTVIIIASVCAGVAVIILVIILAICLKRRSRRQREPPKKTYEENDYIQDMDNTHRQNDGADYVVTYATSGKPTRENENGTSKEYDISHDNAKKVSDISHSDNNYAVVDKVRRVKENTECTEEVYDTTHDNKKKGPLDNVNEYAVLSLKANSSVAIGKLNGPPPEVGIDIYDTTNDNKNKHVLHLDNIYSSIDGSSKGGINEAENTSPLYDTTSKDKKRKVRPANNDYDVFSLDSEKNMK